MTRSTDLKPDCANCAALCCVVFAFDKSESFALDKAAGEPCPNLDGCGRCQVFSQRDALGFKGCIAYDCHGAGQVITQDVFQGRTWRDDAALGARMGAALSVLRRIHEQLSLLETAARLPLDRDELAGLSALKARLTPEETWTEANLQSFRIDDTDRRVRGFLMGLRRHVDGGINARN